MRTITAFAIALALLIAAAGCGGGGGNGSGFYGYIPVNPNPTPTTDPTQPYDKDAVIVTLGGENTAYVESTDTEAVFRMELGTSWTSKAPDKKGEGGTGLSPELGKGRGETVVASFPRNDLPKQITMEFPLYDNTGKRLTSIRIVQKASEAPPKEKAWLFVTYIAGDNNLCPYQLSNLDSMEKIGSDENTSIVAFIDAGAYPDVSGTQWANTLDWTGARSFYITKDEENYKINSQMLTDYGDDVDSGSADTLEKFLTETMRNFPSKYVALVLNDHGGAYKGSMQDYASGTIMRNPDLKKAILNAEKATGRKIDVIGFDACLMASFESIYELKDTADYLTVSEELTIATGWPYDSILYAANNINIRAIEEVQRKYKSKISEEVTPELFAQITLYMIANNTFYIPVFAMLDTSVFEDVKEKTDALAKAVLEATEDNEALRAEIRGIMLKNADGTPAIMYGGSGEYGLYDLYNIADSMYTQCADETLKNAANALKEPLSRAIVYYTNDGDSRPEYKYSYGISIMASKNDYESVSEYYEAHDFIKNTSWLDMLKRLGAVN